MSSGSISSGSISSELEMPVSAPALPNLVLAGVPKAGTSSLFALLATHPAICGSAPKETFYFVDADNPLRRPEANYQQHGLERYTFFAHRSPRNSFLLEGTTHYLYQQTALNFFAQLQPQPHVVVILRKPSARILSSFRYTQNNLARLDPTVSFAQFTDLLLSDQLDPIRDRFYSEKSFFVLQHDLRYSQYHRYLQQWAERFDRDRLHILLFEDLKANPQRTLSQLAQQLGLAPQFDWSLLDRPQNPTTPIKHSALHRWLRHTVPQWPALPLKSRLKSLYFQLQSQPAAVSPAETEALRRLDDYFAADNARLAQAFGLNLSGWQ